MKYLNIILSVVVAASVACSRKPQTIEKSNKGNTTSTGVNTSSSADQSLGNPFTDSGSKSGNSNIGGSNAQNNQQGTNNNPLTPNYGTGTGTSNNYSNNNNQNNYSQNNNNPNNLQNIVPSKFEWDGATDRFLDPALQPK